MERSEGEAKEGIPLQRVGMQQPRSYGAVGNERECQDGGEGRRWEGWDDGSNGAHRRSNNDTSNNDNAADKEKGKGKKERNHLSSSIFEKKADGVDLYVSRYTYQPDQEGFYFYVKEDSPTPEVIHVKEIQASIFDEWCPYFRLAEWELSLPYLILLGTLSGIVSACIDYCIDYLQLCTYP